MIITLVGRKNGQSGSVHENLSKMMIDLAKVIYSRGHVPIFDVNFIVGTDFDEHAEDLVKVQVADVCIVMGGDGTMLSASKALAMNNVQGIPILGINLGRVGFITDVPHDFNYDRLIMMLEKQEYVIEQRTMLALHGTTEIWKLALNDVMMTRSTGKIIEFNVRVDDEHAYTARGDGIMITTPTGSTAYALSGGGPIIHPTARVIEILPIMAQSLSTRPLIINDTSSVDVELISGEARIYVDGNHHLEMQPGEHIRVDLADRKVNLIHPKIEELSYSYYSTLAEKLNWHHLPGTPR